MINCLLSIRSPAQFFLADHHLLDQLRHARFNNRTVAPIYDPDFGGIDIDADDLVTFTCKARCRNTTHVTKTEDTDSHKGLFKDLRLVEPNLDLSCFTCHSLHSALLDSAAH